MGVIKQLKQFITGTNIFPITKTNAVYDNTFGRLDKFLRNTLVESDVLEGETEDTPRDADRLGGQLPEYFAKQSDLDTLNSNLSSSIILSQEYSITIPSGTSSYYETILTAPVPEGYKLLHIIGLRATVASIYFYSTGRKLSDNTIQIGCNYKDLVDFGGVTVYYRFIYVKSNMLEVH